MPGASLGLDVFVIGDMNTGAPLVNDTEPTQLTKKDVHRNKAEGKRAGLAYSSRGEIAQADWQRYIPCSSY